MKHGQFIRNTLITSILAGLVLQAGCTKITAESTLDLMQPMIGRDVAVAEIYIGEPAAVEYDRDSVNYRWDKAMTFRLLSAQTGSTVKTYNWTCRLYIETGKDRIIRDIDMNGDGQACRWFYNQVKKHI